MPRRRSSHEHAYSEEQLQRLWQTSKELRDKVIVGCLGYLGLRVSELAHLKLDWFRNGEIHIPSSQPCICSECEDGCWKPKTKAGVRVIPIPGFLKPVLAEFLSLSPGGIGLKRKAIWYRVKQLIKEAGLPYGFCHSLRATAATILASKGFTAAELCAYFGWARISVGESYVRLSEARKGARSKIKEIYG